MGPESPSLWWGERKGGQVMVMLGRLFQDSETPDPIIQRYLMTESSHGLFMYRYYILVEGYTGFTHSYIGPSCSFT